MVVDGVASFRLLIGESDLTYQYRSPVPVNIGARMRTGAPFAKARMTPAAPTPAPMSAEPEMTAWIVSPAPLVPTFSRTMPCFLKIPASWPSVGAWFSQLLIWPMATLSWSSAAAGCDSADTSGSARPSTAAVSVRCFTRVLPGSFSDSVPPRRPFNTASHSDAKRQFQRRRAFLRDGALRAPREDALTGARPRFGTALVSGTIKPARPSRPNQYSQERVRPVVLVLILAASSASPRDSNVTVPMTVARAWNSALRAEKMLRNTQSRTLVPTAVTPWRRINTRLCAPSARASEAPSSGLITSMLVSPNSSCWSQYGGRMPPTAPR